MKIRSSYIDVELVLLDFLFIICQTGTLGLLNTLNESPDVITVVPQMLLGEPLLILQEDVVDELTTLFRYFAPILSQISTDKILP